MSSATAASCRRHVDSDTTSNTDSDTDVTADLRTQRRHHTTTSHDPHHAPMTLTMNAFIVLGGFLLAISIALNGIAGRQTSANTNGFWGQPDASAKLIHVVAGYVFFLACLPLAVGIVPQVFTDLFEQVVVAILGLAVIARFKVNLAALISLTVLIPFDILRYSIALASRAIVRGYRAIASRF